MTTGESIRFRELKDMILQQTKIINSLNEMMETLQKQITEKNEKEKELQQIIANLQAQLDYLKSKLYGASSEKRKYVNSNQLSIFDSENEKQEQEEEKAAEVEVEKVPVKRKERKHKASYDEMFSKIETEKKYVDTLTEEQKKCPICGEKLKAIGHELIRTEILYIPAKLKRINYYGTTYECFKCKETSAGAEDNYFIKDEGKEALISGSYVSESLAAWTMYQKFVNSIPFYRQEKDMEQNGVKISRGTMADWAITCSKTYFKPIYDYFHRELLKRKFLMADETPVQVLHEDGKRAQSKSYVWLMRSGEDGMPKIILFQYTPTRAGENAAEFLKGIENGTYLMVDGYQGYNKVPNVKLCNCWAHVRRYLIEAIPNGKEKDYTEPAVQGVLYIDKLFHYEKTYQEKGLSFEKIYEKRLKDEKPILEAFWVWFDKLNPIKGTRLERAYIYITGRRKNLMTYLEDGRCSFSNNPSENSIRPFTVGRKNWLFCNSTDGADANAIIYTMVEMAKAYNLNIYQYLNFILEQRPSSDMTDEQLFNFAPWNETVQKTCNTEKKEAIS